MSETMTEMKNSRKQIEPRRYQSQGRETRVAGGEHAETKTPKEQFLRKAGWPCHVLPYLIINSNRAAFRCPRGLVSVRKHRSCQRILAKRDKRKRQSRNLSQQSQRDLDLAISDLVMGTSLEDPCATATDPRPPSPCSSCTSSTAFRLVLVMQRHAGGWWIHRESPEAAPKFSLDRRVSRLFCIVVHPWESPFLYIVGRRFRVQDTCEIFSSGPEVPMLRRWPAFDKSACAVMTTRINIPCLPRRRRLSV